MNKEQKFTQDEENTAAARCSMIEQRSAYTRNDEGNLVVYVPDETQPVAPTSTTAWDDEVRAFKRKAGRLGGQLNMGLEKVEIRQTTDFGELVATLHQLSQPDSGRRS